MAQSFSIEAVLSARDEGFIAGMEHANKATQSLGKTIKSGIGFGALMNVGSRAVDIVIRGISSITSHTDAAIKRVDTLNNFPIIMKNLGYSTKDANKALDKMNKGIDGLPTSMDAIASATQKIAPLTGSLSEATDVTLALNDALLAGGKSTEAQSNALEQYSQMLAAGKVDMVGWQSMVAAMPGQLDQVAKSLLGAKAGNMDLYEAMKTGEISFGDFNKALLDLDKNGLKAGGKAYASFADQAKDATQGIQTSITNVETAITRGLANTIKAGNNLLERLGLPKINKALDVLKGKIGGTFDAINGYIDSINTGNIGQLIDKAKQGGAALAAFAFASKAFRFFNQNADLISAGTNKIKSSIKEIPTLMTRLKTGATKTGIGLKKMVPEGLSKSLGTIGKELKASTIGAAGNAIKSTKAWNVMADTYTQTAFKFQAMTGRFDKDQGLLWKTLGKTKEKFGQAANGIVGVAGKMVSGLQTMMSMAMKALLPAALIAAALAGMGVLYQQFGAQIDQILAMVQAKGPQVISNFVNGIVSALPSLIASGAQMLSGLLDTITTLAPSLIQGGVDIVAALVSGLGSALPTLLPSAINMVGTVVTGILGAIPQLLSVGMRFLAELSAGIASNIPLLISKAKEAISGFIQGMSSNLPGILNSAAKIVTNLVQGIVKGLPQLIRSGIELVIQLGQAIIKNLPTILSVGMQVLVTLALGLVKAIPALLSGIGKGILALIKAVTSIDWLSLGGKVVKAIGEGIMNGLGPIGSKIGKFFGIKTDWSGSGKKGGADMAKSTGEGFKANEDQVTSAAESTSNAAIEKMSASFEAGSGAIKDMGDVLGKDAMEAMKTSMESGADAVSSTAGNAGTDAAELLTQNLSAGTADAATAVEELAGKITASKSSITEFTTIVQALAEKLTALQTGVMNIGPAISFMGNSVNAAKNSFSALKTEAAAMVGSVVATASLMVAAVGPFAVFSTSAKQASTASGTLSGSLKSASSALGGIGRNASSAGKGLSAVARMGQSVKSALSSMQKTAQAAMDVLSKSFVTVGKNAEKSGKQVGDGFSKRLQAGLKKGASLSQTEGRLIGTRFTTALKGSISKANSIASQAVSAMAARIRAGRGAAYSAGSYVGLGVAAGMRSALPAVTAAANAIIAQVNRAMRARAKIHSPSDLTAEIGEYLTQGVIKGLEKLMPAAKKSSEGLIDKILNAAEKATGNKTIGSMLLNPYQKIGSVTGNAKKMISTYAAKLKKATSAAKGGYKSIGTTLNKAFESTLTSGQKTLLKKGNTAIQSLTDKYYGTTGINKTIAKNKKTIKKLQLANKTASAATKKANTKRINELQKDNNKLSDKTKKQQKKSDKLSTQIYSQYEKYVKSATTKAINAAQSAITKLTEKYQEMYDKVIEKRTSFYNTLSSVGDLYTVDDYGYLAFKDFKAAKKQVDAYSKNIEKLKKLLPDGLMEEILSMDTAKGLEYTNQLLKKSEAQIKAYGKDYTAFINSAAKASNTYYQPQLDAIKKQFNAAATKEMETLKKQMDQIGQDSVTGFINGIAKKNKKLKKAAKAMGLTVSGTVKKILGIKSPSRIFAAIGQYVGKGYIKGMDSMRRKIQKTSVRMVDIPTAQRPRLAFAGGDLSDEYDYNSQIKYEITVVSEIDGRQVAKATAKPMEEEMSKRAAREQRKNGKKS